MNNQFLTISDLSKDTLDEVLDVSLELKKNPQKHAPLKNKFLGLLMSFSLLFLPPAIFPEFAGKLFPLTYGIFIIYLFFTYGLNMYRNWKNNAGL